MERRRVGEQDLPLCEHSGRIGTARIRHTAKLRAAAVGQICRTYIVGRVAHGANIDVRRLTRRATCRLDPSAIVVAPAQAGAQGQSPTLDLGLRRDDWSILMRTVASLRKSQ